MRYRIEIEKWSFVSRRVHQFCTTTLGFLYSYFSITIVDLLTLLEILIFLNCFSIHASIDGSEIDESIEWHKIYSIYIFLELFQYIIIYIMLSVPCDALWVWKYEGKLDENLGLYSSIYQKERDRIFRGEYAKQKEFEKLQSTDIERNYLSVYIQVSRKQLPKMGWTHFGIILINLLGRKERRPRWDLKRAATAGARGLPFDSPQFLNVP